MPVQRLQELCWGGLRRSVLVILEKLSKGLSVASIAQDFKTSRQTIMLLRDRERQTQDYQSDLNVGDHTSLRVSAVVAKGGGGKSASDSFEDAPSLSQSIFRFRFSAETPTE